MASSDRFERLVASAVGSLPSRLAVHLAGVRVMIEDVPPARPRGSEAEVPLCRYDRDDSPPDRLVLYRRPIEARAISHHDLVDLVRQTLSQQIARQIGTDEDLEGFGGD